MLSPFSLISCIIDDAFLYVFNLFVVSSCERTQIAMTSNWEKTSKESYNVEAMPSWENGGVGPAIGVALAMYWMFNKTPYWMK
jgi:hypothetical protein